MILFKAEDIALQCWLLLALWISLISFHMFKLSLPFVSMRTCHIKRFFKLYHFSYLFLQRPEDYQLTEYERLLGYLAKEERIKKNPAPQAKNPFFFVKNVQ